MKRFECEFEAEVLSAVMQSRWPERAGAELREHAAHCEICSSVAAIAPAIEAESETMRAAVVVPSADKVWWMAQRRARREAEAAAARPITAIQIIAFACAVGLLGACFGATSVWFQSLLKNLGDIKFSALASSAMALFAAHGLLVVGMAALLLLAPAAVYLAIARD